MSGGPTYPCPVCGYLVFDEPPGSYTICPICFWEDDIVQIGFPLMAGGANRLSLHEAQQEFVRNGACEFRLIGHVRTANDSDKRDPTWRPFDPTRDLYLRWDLPADSERWRAAGGCLSLLLATRILAAPQEHSLSHFENVDSLTNEHCTGTHIEGWQRHSFVGLHFLSQPDTSRRSTDQDD